MERAIHITPAVAPPPGRRRNADRFVYSALHALHRPIPIIFGIIGAIAGVMWLVAAGADGGPSGALFFAFGWWYLSLRVMKELFREPMNVLPAFGILIASAGLIWLGIVML